MRKIRVCGLLAAIGMMAAAGEAFAAIMLAVEVNCTTPSALLTAFASGGMENTTYSIINGPCTGGITITQDNITISGNQAINGSVTVNGARNIVLGGGLTIQNAAGDGVIAQGAHVTVTNSTIQNNGGRGVWATGGASVSVLFSTVSGNAGGGVWAQENSTLTYNGTISSAGGSMVGPAVAAILSSSVRMQSVSTVIGPDNAPTIFADQNSAVFIDPGSTISTSDASTAGPAIVALKSSSATLVGATVNGPSANHTIFAAQASSLTLNGSTVTAVDAFKGTNPLAVITATGSSSAVLAGGNTITNTAMGGAAVIVSDGSSFIDVDGTRFGFTAGPDTINGDGRIFTQSVMELATASGVGIVWSGNIFAFAASSFRSDGGDVTVNGTLTLDQAANGYFNHQNGTTNTIIVVCKSTTDHVTNPTFVTPNITIGAPPGCALF